MELRRETGHRSPERIEKMTDSGHHRWRSETVDDLRDLVEREGIRRFADLYQHGWSQNLASRILREAGIRWPDFVGQIHDDYENNIPALFVSNLFSFGTEGKTFRYAAIKTPIEKWSPWRVLESRKTSSLKDISEVVEVNQVHFDGYKGL